MSGASQEVLVVMNPSANARDLRDREFDPWVGKLPWRRAWPLTAVFLAGESHAQRSLAAYSCYCHKESDVTKWLSMHAHFVWLLSLNIILWNSSKLLCISVICSFHCYVLFQRVNISQLISLPFCCFKFRIVKNNDSLNTTQARKYTFFRRIHMLMHFFLFFH